MAEKQLLLMVQVTCAPEHLEPFNLWCNSHLPNLLRIPGYLWAQRYMGMEDPSRFVALYGIRGEDDLPNLLDWDGPNLHPIAKAEFAGWRKLQGLSDIMLNVYEQIMGTPLHDPFLRSDGPINVTATEPDPAHEEEWNRWYSESHVPNLLKIPGYIMAGRFRLLEHPVSTKVNTWPRYLALYECESEAVIPSLRVGPDMRPEAREEFELFRRDWLPYTRNASRGFYRMISKHFEWTDG
ncbi:MAG: hypothetical protein O7D33_09365 [Chloroflexi bacterium]|nr:hypothetical protein [Chloroflexota bacterium]